MDPNARLKELLDLARDNERDGTDNYCMAALVLSLDEWLEGGGSLPSRWERKEAENADARR